jgi:hypothetical protein
LGVVLILAVSALVVQWSAGELRAAPGDRLWIADQLPPVEGRELCNLSWDDGTCESGLGYSAATWSCLVDFNVPTGTAYPVDCSVIGLTVKANSGTAHSFVMYQAGQGPGNGRIAVPLASPIVGTGWCPTNQGWQTRALPSYSAPIMATPNFFAGVYGDLYVGRDTNGLPAGKHWVCASSGAVCYSPTYLAAVGYGGNLMIRVVVEAVSFGWVDCYPDVPIELIFIDGYETGDTTEWSGTTP